MTCPHAVSSPHRRTIATGVDVPQPAPDVVPLPPAESPVEIPPEIIEPPMPGEHVPVRDPIAPGDAGHGPVLH